jgi:hypothetical protein
MTQISIIKKSDILEARRFDAEYFKAEIINFLNLNLNLKNFGEDIDFFSTGKNLKQYDLENKKNEIFFIRNTNIKNIFINETKLTKINSHEKNFLKLKEGNLLFSRVGNVGDLSIVTKNFENKTVSDNVIVIKLKTLNPFYTVVFLKTKIGKLFLEIIKKGSVQSLISTENFFSLKIPLLP